MIPEWLACILIVFMFIHGFLLGRASGLADVDPFWKSYLDGISLRFIWGRFIGVGNGQGTDHNSRESSDDSGEREGRRLAAGLHDQARREDDLRSWSEGQGGDRTDRPSYH